MALEEVRARTRNAFRVVVSVLIGSALVGLCLSHVLALPVDPERYSQSDISFATGISARGVVMTQGSVLLQGVDEASSLPNSVRSAYLDHKPRQSNVSVRSVTLRHVVARGEEVENLNRDSNQNVENDPYESEGVEASSSWSVDPEADPAISKRILKRIPKGMTVQASRGRSLRTSKWPTYPCNLPTGACQQPGKTCCGNACVTLSNNSGHCGRCGHFCSAKRVCCSGKCRRLSTDEKNCGRCGARCAPGTKCLFGLCGY